jgi:hypothetical protein
VGPQAQPQVGALGTVKAQGPVYFDAPQPAHFDDVCSVLRYRQAVGSGQHQVLAVLRERGRHLGPGAGAVILQDLGLEPLVKGVKVVRPGPGRRRLASRDASLLDSTVGSLSEWKRAVPSS